MNKYTQTFILDIHLSGSCQKEGMSINYSSQYMVKHASCQWKLKFIKVQVAFGIVQSKANYFLFIKGFGDCVFAITIHVQGIIVLWPNMKLIYGVKLYFCLALNEKSLVLSCISQFWKLHVQALVLAFPSVNIHYNSLRTSNFWSQISEDAYGSQEHAQSDKWSFT